MDENTKEGQLLEFAYGKYGQHIVAIKCNGFNRELFDTCKLFMEKDTRAEYERVKGDAAQWAKDFVKTYNDGKNVIEIIAGVLWRLDYPNPENNGIYKTYESTPFHDKELYRKQAKEILSKNAPIN